MAVTCVDFQVHKSLGPLLATSSDDRTVCLFHVNGVASDEATQVPSADLLSTYRTSGLYVTYCAIQPGGNYVACTTLDGVVYVWSLLDGVLEVKRKRHIGSIEGISFTHADVGNCIATTGSDCTVSVLEFHP